MPSRQQQHQPVKCGLRHKLQSKCLQVFEGIFAKLLLTISICSIIYSDNWLTVAINFTFLTMQIFALVTYAMCYKKAHPIYVMPMMINLTVLIFWIFIWVYASIASIHSGYLWSLEWLGGPKSSRQRASNDVSDPNYVDPNETHPEVKKSIKFGIIICAVSLVFMVLKVIGWRICRNTYLELREVHRERRMNKEIEHTSDLSAASPAFVSVQRLELPINSRSLPRSPPPSYQYVEEREGLMTVPKVPKLMTESSF